MAASKKYLKKQTGLAIFARPARQVTIVSNSAAWRS